MKADFKFEFEGYTVYPGKFKRTKTRQGLRAVCDIYRDGKKVATLDDEPSPIVARVLTENAAERAALVKAAKKAKVKPSWPNPTDACYLSEYLRKRTMEAEQAWVEAK